MSFRDKMKRSSEDLASKKQERMAEKARLSDAARAYNANQVKLPDYVTVESYDSDAWKHLRSLSPNGFSGVQGTLIALLRGESYDQAYANVHMRTPLYMDKDPMWFRDSLHSLVSGSRFASREAQWRDDFGPFFTRPISEWAEKRVFALFKPKEGYEPNWSVLNSVVDRLVADVEEACGGTLPTALELTETYLHVKKGKNSGYPFYVSKWEAMKMPVEMEGCETIMDWVNQQIEADPDGNELKAPHVMYTRTRPRGKIANERAVQCPELMEKFHSTRIRVPLTDALQKVAEFRGLNGIYTMTDVFREGMEYFPHRYATDYSAFDANLHPEYLKFIIEHVIPRLVKDCDVLCKNLSRYMVTSPLMTPWGVMNSISGEHGLFSGDGLTSIVGCLANYLAMGCAMRECGYEDDEWFGWYFGDDTQLMCTRPIDLTVLAAMLKKYSVVLSADKSESDSVNFLAHDFYESCEGPVYCCMRGAPSFVWYEKSPKEALTLSDTRGSGGMLSRKQLAAIRIVGKLDVMIYHENYVEIVKFIRNGHPHKLASWLVSPGIHLAKDLVDKVDGAELVLDDISSPTLRLIAQLEAEEGLIRPTSSELQALLSDYSNDELSGAEQQQWELLVKKLPPEAVAKVLRHAHTDNLEAVAPVERRKAIERYAKLLVVGI